MKLSPDKSRVWLNDRHHFTGRPFKDGHWRDKIKIAHTKRAANLTVCVCLSVWSRPVSIQSVSEWVCVYLSTQWSRHPLPLVAADIYRCSLLTTKAAVALTDQSEWNESNHQRTHTQTNDIVCSNCRSCRCHLNAKSYCSKTLQEVPSRSSTTIDWQWQWQTDHQHTEKL